LAAGVTRVSVRRLPKVIIIPTGSELIPASELDRELPPDHLPEFNSVILAGLVTEAGGVPEVRAIVPDDVASLTRALKDALGGADVVIINAGSSAGTEDYTYQAVANLGEVLVHGVSMMPGKPTLLGVVDGKPVRGNPGYPVPPCCPLNSLSPRSCPASRVSLFHPALPWRFTRPKTCLPSPGSLNLSG